MLPPIPTLEPSLPPAISGLHRLAYNLYWAWDPAAEDLFLRIDPDGFPVHRNPVLALQSRPSLDGLVRDETFMAAYARIVARFQRYLETPEPRWLPADAPAPADGAIAYFCSEFGLHECLPIYAGGLGVLAGDQCKTASDLSMPFVGVGLLYRRGYFRQSVDAEGDQDHTYPPIDPRQLPVLRVAHPRRGDPLKVAVEFPDRIVQCAVWVVHVGRIPLLLLDTNIEENSLADRPITGNLYSRGREMRLHQEILLGVGGVRTLRALGIVPAAWHLNEGHSALALLERVREVSSAGARLEEAFENVRRNTVFSLHTPLPAGHERFDSELVRKLVAPILAGSGVDVDRVMEVGRGLDGDPGVFDMTSFCLRLSHHHNAVSALHSRTATATWRGVVGEIPGVANGVHAPTWLGPKIGGLLEAAGIDRMNLLDLAGDPTHPSDRRIMERLLAVNDRQLWEAHVEQKRTLVSFIRNRFYDQGVTRGEPPRILKSLLHALDPERLTIGFARRMAAYKRPLLLFSDEDRLLRLLDNRSQPVQVLLAGKAHPADRLGRGALEEIIRRVHSPRLVPHVFFIEDYDMHVARLLVQGVDVWLNTPRRPLEACGTSGMKAAINGVPNLSCLDGWWDEGYDGTNGWAIGGRETHPDESHQDRMDADSLYRLLETEIVPRYYDRDLDGLPRAWLFTMRRSISAALWRFSATRMLRDYARLFYLPAMQGGRKLE